MSTKYQIKYTWAKLKLHCQHTYKQIQMSDDVKRLPIELEPETNETQARASQCILSVFCAPASFAGGRCTANHNG